MMPEYESWEREQFRQAEEKARKEGYDAGWKAAQAQQDAGAVGRETATAGEEWLPIETAPKDGTPVLALFKDHIYPALRPERADLEVWNGMQAILRHQPLPDDGFDTGWSFAAPVGMGGFPDEWIEGWQPLPTAPQQRERDIELIEYIRKNYNLPNAKASSAKILAAFNASRSGGER